MRFSKSDCFADRPRHHRAGAALFDTHHAVALDGCTPIRFVISRARWRNYMPLEVPDGPSNGLRLRSQAVDIRVSAGLARGGPVGSRLAARSLVDFWFSGEYAA